MSQNTDGARVLNSAPTFDPAAGTVVREPTGDGPGYWCGAPGAYFDQESGDFYLYYRVRVEKAKGRGIEFRIARGRDGVEFEDVWTCPKDDIGAVSIEGGSIFRLPDGEWAVAYGFVDERDDRWKMGLLRGPDPAHFDTATHEIVLDPDTEAIAGVKDPVIARVDGEYRMVMSYHLVSARERSDPALLEIADTIATGMGTSNTGLATSRDGRKWTWVGDVLAPTPGRWDAFCARVTGFFPGPVGFVAFYDGSVDVSENYEERGSLAWSPDLTVFHALETAGPLFVSEFGGGSVRYVEPLLIGDTLFVYYEYTRADGGHQLRVVRLPVLTDGKWDQEARLGRALANGSRGRVADRRNGPTPESAPSRRRRCTGRATSAGRTTYRRRNFHQRGSGDRC